MNQEPSVIKYISILFQWKRFIVINFIVVFLLAVIVSLILPQWYKATASLLPPKQPDVFGSFGSAGSLLKGIGGLGKIGGLGQRTSAYNYFAILHSRTTLEAVIKKFDLISVYEVSDSSIEKAIKALEENVAFEEQSDENITIEVYDKDPIRSSAIANYFVELLNEVSAKLGTQEARNNKEFIERRLLEAKHNLSETEDTLRAFQENSGLMLTPEQTTSISAIAALYAMKAKLEVEVAIMERNVTSNNPVLEQMKMELSELNKKIFGIPRTGLKSFRLYRDAMIEQKIVEFLVPIYEQAKIDEQKDVPVLLVLDKAVPAERKSKPQRSLIVFISSFFAFTVSILVVFLFHGIQRLDGEPSAVTLTLLKWTRKIAAWYHIPK
jgi:tyrosine-protein kinase Etk/Wzc